MISAIVLTKNEEKNIADCINCLLWCDEVVVIDDFSEDATAKIAQSLGAKVYRRNLNGDFSAQRNFGLEKAEGEWVLFVDADERVTEKLGMEIRGVTNSLRSESICHFYLRRIDIMWGGELKHGEVGNTWLLRLGKKGACKWKRKVHEHWDVKGEVTKLSNPLLHYPHETLSEFISDINFYSGLHAEQKYKEGKRSSLLKIILWPKLKFINNWVFRLGFLDGTAGFVHAVLMSFHSFLAWSKLWLIQRGDDS